MSSISMTKPYRSLVCFTNRHFPILLAKLRFRKLFGRKLNLKNPQDINEKILWLSLFSDTTDWSRLADKYTVREYVAECGLEDILVKLYGKWDTANAIDWASLPNGFVLKTNNGSGTVMIVQDKNQIEKPEVVETLNSWLNKDIASSTTEFHYKSIPPCIIAEELLEPSDEEKTWSTSIIDYKIWCFNGKVDSIWTCSNRVKGSTEVALFDKEWHYRPEASVFNVHYKEQQKLVPKPECLSQLIEIAEKLSKPFPVVRCDLYVIKGRPYFGEMTFTSLGGTMNFYTDAELLRMGRKIDLSGVRRIKRKL